MFFQEDDTKDENGLTKRERNIIALKELWDKCPELKPTAVVAGTLEAEAWTRYNNWDKIPKDIRDKIIADSGLSENQVFVWIEWAVWCNYQNQNWLFGYQLKDTNSVFFWGPSPTHTEDGIVPGSRFVPGVMITDHDGKKVQADARCFFYDSWVTNMTDAGDILKPVHCGDDTYYAGLDYANFTGCTLEINARGAYLPSGKGVFSFSLYIPSDNESPMFAGYYLNPSAEPNGTTPGITPNDPFLVTVVKYSKGNITVQIWNQLTGKSVYYNDNYHFGDPAGGWGDFLFSNLLFRTPKENRFRFMWGAR